MILKRTRTSNDTHAVTTVRMAATDQSLGDAEFELTLFRMVRNHWATHGCEMTHCLQYMAATRMAATASESR